VLGLLGGLKLGIRGADADIAPVLRRFIPAVAARGSVQLSGYLDLFLVGRLARGGFSGLAYAQTIYQLPISLFGMAVSAAELPEISAAAGGAVEPDSAGALELRRRLGAALRRTLFFVLPSAAAIAFFGDRIVALVYLGGVFQRADVIATWVILIGFAVGIVPATQGRLVATSFFAMHDTRTPLRFAVGRIIVGAILSVLFLFILPMYLAPAIFEANPVWRVAGLSLGGSIAFWLELALLHGAFTMRVGPPDTLPGHTARLIVATAAAVGVGFAARLAFPDLASRLQSIAVLGAFGVTYLGLAAILGVSALPTPGRLLRRR
jgi:putative peptidoglycan lipid II flippase